MPKAPPTAPPADPLADLREPEPEAQGPAPVQGKTATDQDGRMAAIITAWHTDQIARNMGHKGGTCGCRYLAEVALKALES